MAAVIKTLPRISRIYVAQDGGQETSLFCEWQVMEKNKELIFLLRIFHEKCLYLLWLDLAELTPHRTSGNDICLVTDYVT